MFKKMIERIVLPIVQAEVKREVDSMDERYVRPRFARIEHRAVDLVDIGMSNRGVLPGRICEMQKDIDEYKRMLRGHIANDFACVRNKVNVMERGSHEVDEVS